MNLEKLHSVYFLGIGGIGMSALARYFHANGKVVGGYDKTLTPLTESMVEQGMQIHYEDKINLVNSHFLNKDRTLIIRTPAVPDDHKELNFFRENGFVIKKRAEVLGLIFNSRKGIGIAGTHGKTSVSTFVAYILRECGVDASAFLGGISKNFKSNLLLGNSEFVVAEADEFDRSFLHLNPYVALVTTIDADHMDIYSDINDIQNTFSKFLHQVHPEGKIILRKGIELKTPFGIRQFSYALDDPSADVYASDIRVEKGSYFFTLNTPNGCFQNFNLKVPGKTNIENSLAAITICISIGIDETEIQKALPKLKGAVRRFDFQLQTEKITYIDDYAHHPSELDAVISSIKDLYPGKKITGVFQPHLYTRTRDFENEFARSLSKLDELILLDIYPAREKPLAGVTSEALLGKIAMKSKHYCSKENLLHKLKGLNIEVLLTLGAGDIDQFVGPIKDMLLKSEED
jgi:UDP-N-acetylmuramate--alanine ligase